MNLWQPGEADVRNLETTRPAFVVWLRDLMRGPLATDGDYFDRLRGSIASSAPVRYPCR